MTVVFKLGGSLLDLPHFADRLQQVIQMRSGTQRLILTGGGAAADVVRDWSRIHNLSEETAHWLAIASLDLNRAFVQSQTHWPSASSREEAGSFWNRTGCPVQIQFNEFCRIEEGKPGEPLPHHWNVTSDSLAAWTAIRWPATELILLKSVPVPDRFTVLDAAREGIVDPYFPQLSKHLPRISWCDLRGADPTITTWLEQS